MVWARPKIQAEWAPCGSKESLRGGGEVTFRFLQCVLGWGKTLLPFPSLSKHTRALGKLL